MNKFLAAKSFLFSWLVNGTYKSPIKLMIFGIVAAPFGVWLLESFFAIMLLKNH
jgi:hypothetical protein